MEEEIPWLDYNVCVVLVNTMVSETSYSHVYNALSSPTLREKLYIPQEIWKHLESSLKQKIEKIRKEIESEHATGPTSNPAKWNPPKPAPAILPAQYPTMAANHTNAILNSVAELPSTEDSDTDVNWWSWWPKFPMKKTLKMNLKT